MIQNVVNIVTEIITFLNSFNFGKMRRHKDIFLKLRFEKKKLMFDIP